MLPNKKYTPWDFLALARKYALLIVVPPAVGLYLALVFSAGLPNIYQAQTLLQIVPQKVPDRFVPSTVTIQTEDRIEALGQQVKGRAFLEKLILDLDLYAAERKVLPMQDIVEIMRASMDLETLRPNRMAPVDSFYVRFKYGDPVLAARATERLSEGYILQNARERGALAEGAKDFLDSQLADAKARLEAQERLLQGFREQNAGKLPTQLDATRQAIQNLHMQRTTVVAGLEADRARRLTLERLYNDTLVAPIPVAQLPSSAPAATTTMPARQRLELERANLKQLQQRLTADHPDVRRSLRQIDELEKLAANEPAPSPNTPAALPAGITPEAAQRRSQLSSLQADLAGLERSIAAKEAEERRLSNSISEYQARIEAMPGVESRWLSISRDYDTHKKTFDDLLAKSESAKTAVNLENRQVGEQFRVLDPPRAPGVPVSPNRLLISGVGFGAGLAIGLLLIAGLELRDGSFKSEAEIEQVLALPVIAVVPNLITESDRAAQRHRRQIVALASAVVVVAAGWGFWAMRLWTFVV